MTAKKNYVNPTIAEASFRELLKDQPMGIKVDQVTRTLNDMVHHSFKDGNIFEHKYVDGNKKVRLEHQVTVNRENAYAWAKREPHNEYNLKLPGIIIPLKVPDDSIVKKARLVLVNPIGAMVSIEIHVFFLGSTDWAVIPVTTTNVLNILTHLFQG